MSATTITPANSRLFKPLKVGPVDLAHRVVMAPLTRNRNDYENTPTNPLMERYYSDRGSVPGTLVISEATGVSRQESGQRHTPGFHSADQVAAWKSIISGVHAKGSFWFQQLWGLGRAAQPDLQAERGLPYKTASAVPMSPEAPAPEEMTEDDILRTIADYASAAKKVVHEAGGDGVEVHGAHGYLLDQFLSDAVNKRTDRWGGSVENRARLLLETVKAVAEAVGPERTALRLSPYAGFQGAVKSDIEAQYTYVMEELKKIPGEPLAYVSLVEARGDPAALVLGTEAPNKDKTLDFVLEAWGGRSPVMVAGAFTPENAATALETRYARWDNVLVAFGRHFLANPDLPFRIREGLPLNKYDRDTFYKVMSNDGYNTYPFSEEFLKLNPQAAGAN